MDLTHLLALERERNQRLQAQIVEARASLEAVLRAWILTGIAPSTNPSVKEALERARKVLGWKGRAGPPSHGRER